MNKSPKISIIVPCFNVENSVQETLDSILLQSYSNFEIICVDDKSTDKTLSVLQNYTEKDERITVLKHDVNKSLYMARKTGLSVASGDYVMHVDSDDTISKDALEILVSSVSKENPDIILFQTKIVDAGGNKKSEIDDFEKAVSFKLKENKVYSGEELAKKCFIEHKINYAVWNKIYKRELAQKVYSLGGDCYKNMSEDLYAFMFVLPKVEKAVFINKKLYEYKVGCGMSTKNITPFINTRNRLQMIEFINQAREILKDKDCCKKFIAIYNRFSEETMYYIFDSFVYDLSIDEGAEIFENIITQIGFEKAVDYLKKNYSFAKTLFMQKILNCKTVKENLEEYKKYKNFAKLCESKDKKIKPNKKRNYLKIKHSIKFNGLFGTIKRMIKNIF